MRTREEQIARVNDQADWYLRNGEGVSSREINARRDEAIEKIESEFEELEKNLRWRCEDKLDSLPYSLEISGYRVVLERAGYPLLLEIAKEIGLTPNPHPDISCDKCGHKSDCATHNEPALPNGECDCKSVEASQ